MNRTPVYTLSSFDYVSARREAEGLRRREIARLVNDGAAWLSDAGRLIVASTRRTLERIRAARSQTFFGAS